MVNGMLALAAVVLWVGAFAWYFVGLGQIRTTLAGWLRAALPRRR